jgi:hypothetical protein
VQTYHTLVATHFPPPVPSAVRALAVEEILPESTAPATVAALEHIDRLFRRALGGSGFEGSFSWFKFDDLTATLTTTILLLVVYLLLLGFKLVWGMFLLALARRRYASMALRETEQVDAEGKRKGGWGVVEVGEERRRTVYEGDEASLRKLREKERKGEDSKGREVDYGRIRRYDMVAKRIW